MRSTFKPRRKHLLAGLLACSTVYAADYSPYAKRDYPTEVFWGDTHLHTNLSMDAAAFGNRLGLEEAYRFARGETVESSSGQPVRLSRPLDFLVAADHSDGAGLFGLLASGDPSLTQYPDARRWHEMLRQGKNKSVAEEMINRFSNDDLSFDIVDPALATPVWHQVVDTAERFNDPGKFTAFIGYEWTALDAGNNLHRVVLYRDGADRLRDYLPFNASTSIDPEALWDHLAEYEASTGGQVLAIPHNGNLSNGEMFAPVTGSGQKFSPAYMAERRRWEPLYEITQIKGDSETHPLLSPDDEFADYESWDVGNLDFSQAKTDDMLRYEYAREALKQGLEFQAAQGENPFEFGVIGSTDSHTSLASAEENNFFGKHKVFEPAPGRAEGAYKSAGSIHLMRWQQVSSGYAAVWATENTREALWDALKRREVYGTTGTRMTLRLFAGWDFEAADANSPDIAAIGYAGGVPMGAVLPPAPAAAEAPTLLVAAQRDPIGANLDRLQIVKGWVDADGNAREKVYDVAWSGDRAPGSDGKLPAVGNTVDLDTATWQNSIGTQALATTWRDPDFNPKVPAFYYLRVLEIPTPRWPVYDAVRYGRPLPEGAVLTAQERGYSSAVWYYPDSHPAQ
ncbi:DUF3604 domain-containing protein [Parahaliea mediterranea]|uniref:DUF3604 domain-containing protein n=1 Tax=Parahaliea mediterranea TaxID=651086 RepID=UPI000E2FE31C|nr:DUF3604 domain-containing protein [Parahaliea mediterranea]